MVSQIRSGGISMRLLNDVKSQEGRMTEQGKAFQVARKGDERVKIMLNSCISRLK